MAKETFFLKFIYYYMIKLKAFIKIDLPAPVSPVITLKPSEKFMCKLSITASPFISREVIIENLSLRLIN